jgi:hypothetical protein
VRYRTIARKIPYDFHLVQQTIVYPVVAEKLGFFLVLAAVAYQLLRMQLQLRMKVTYNDVSSLCLRDVPYNKARGTIWHDL